MAVKRKINESPLRQGKDEQISYSLTTTPWGSSPTGAAVVLKSVPEMTDVSSTHLSGAVSTVGDVITSPLVTKLEVGKVYRLEFMFTISGNVFEAFALVEGEE